MTEIRTKILFAPWEFVLMFLCVPDIDQVTVCSDRFVPHPDIRNGFVCRIAVQAGTNIPFQIDAVCVGINRVIPTIHRRAFQSQPYAFGIGFGIVDPSLNVKRRFCGFFFGGQFRLLRLCFRRLCRWFGFGCFRWCGFRGPADGRRRFLFLRCCLLYTSRCV